MQTLSAICAAVLGFLKDDAGGSHMELALLAAIVLALIGLAVLALRKLNFVTT
jgi:Flp pilus assembly pilin Flp